jgi:hypothetical protein
VEVPTNRSVDVKDNVMAVICWLVQSQFLFSKSKKEESYLIDMRRFFCASTVVSSTLIASVAPEPPMASKLCVSPCLRKRFVWCIEPSGDAAKNSRSVLSQARTIIGRGYWKVVSRVLLDRSHSCARRIIDQEEWAILMNSHTLTE